MSLSEFPAIDLPAALSAALEPLTEALALERAERQKLAQEVAQLREDRGRLRAEAAGLHDALEVTQAQLEIARDDLAAERWRWWHRFTKPT